MFKKIISAICAGILATTLVASPMVLQSCAPGQTATQQIAQETKDPVALSQAAYIDAVNTATTVVNLYIDKYQDYVYVRYPEIHQEFVSVIYKLDDLFRTWSVLNQAGVPMDGAEKQFETYLNALTKIMLKIDSMIESGEIKL